MIVDVQKRDGTFEKFQPEKLNKWAEWAANGGVSWSDIVFQAIRKCTDRCKTSDIHQALIKVCIEKNDTRHLQMAGRLLTGEMYKEVFGTFTDIPDLSTFYHTMTKSGLWVFEKEYDEVELDALNEVIDHGKDFEYTYTTLKQIKDKYAISDKLSGKLFETPQFVYMGVAMAVMQHMPEDRRLEDVEKLYEYLSDLKINASTPFLNGPRTDFKGYASCCVIKANDSAKSLGIAEHAAYTMTCSQAGIGIMYETRTVADPVRGGQVVHQGKIPYYRQVDVAVKANKQSSRGGSATMHYTVLDPELEDLIKLKNPKTPDQKRINFMDYSIGVNNLFAKHVAQNLPWMLVSYLYAPNLYKKFYSGHAAEFETEYYRVLGDDSIPKTMVPARTMAEDFLVQGVETGRVYLHWADTMNHHTPFLDTIYSSNLCQEIFLPTSGYENMLELYSNMPTAGEIALCFISAISTGRVSPEEYEDVAYYTLLMIDNIMDLMEYPFEQLGITAHNRRSVGVGMTNVANAMARAGMKYSTREGKTYLHRMAETHSYMLHKAAIRLTEERGPCGWAHKTKYPDGWLPIDTYNKNVDNVCDATLQHDWNEIRKRIIHLKGLRFSVLEATMPCESSSQASNTTNGPYPVRFLRIVKKSGNNKNYFIVPDYDNKKIRDAYELAWDISSKDLIDCYAIMQKFHGQGISADLYIDYSKLPDGKVSKKQLLTDFLYKTKMGLKSRYYINNRTSVTDGEEEEMVDDQESGCDTCSL